MNKFKELFNIENRTKYFFHTLTFFSIISILIFSSLIVSNKAIPKVEAVAEETTKKVDPFKDVALEAKSVVVWDVLNNREIFSKNPNIPLPLASLTKVMTAVTLESEMKEDLQIRIESDYLKAEGDSGLLVGDYWRFSDLRDFTLLTSSNDGALALAVFAEKGTNSELPIETKEENFVQKMNSVSSRIGLTNSRFFNEHGLDRDIDKGGAYGSAKDMALLFNYALTNHREILEATKYKNLQFVSNEKVYSASNTNVFVDQIPGIIASKTGYTDLAGGNLVVAFDAGLNRPIIVSILGSTQEGRFYDALKLVEASVKYIHDN